MIRGLRFLGLLVAELMAGIILAEAGVFACMYAGATLDWIGGLVLAFLVGGPMGGVAGFVLVSVLARRAAGWTGVGTAAALVSAIGIVFGMALANIDLVVFVRLSPAVATAFSMAVYHSCLWRRKMRESGRALNTVAAQHGAAGQP